VLDLAVSTPRLILANPHFPDTSLCLSRPMSKEMVSPTDVTTEAARIIDLRPIIRERDLRSKKSNQGDIRVVSRGVLP